MLENLALIEPLIKNTEICTILVCIFKKEFYNDLLTKITNLNSG